MDPLDTASIANGITQILTNPQLSHSLSCQGLERSRLFSWDRCAEETLALLEKVAAG
jgi:glycosyltransferase involved in cell wall biosynthesis